MCSKTTEFYKIGYFRTNFIQFIVLFNNNAKIIR